MLYANIEELLKAEKRQLENLDELLHSAIDDKNLLSSILDRDEVKVSVGSRMADFVAAFGGSWRFIIWFIAFMALWIVVNAYFLSRPFDHYPFILLNLLLSTLAALQAPVIMMSQNRKEDKDRRRAINDYLVNLKAEVEVRNLHGKLDMLMTEQMKTLFEIQDAQFRMMEEIKEMLNGPVERPVPSLNLNNRI